MKIAYISDTHLEFYRKGDLPTLGEAPADVLVMAGDITNADAAVLDTSVNFFAEASKRYKRVFYVLGNHEHYYGDINKTRHKIQQFLDSWHFTNIHVLDKEYLEYGGVTFFGATFWANPKVPFIVERALNDYFQVTDGVNKLKITRTIAEYEQTMTKLYKLTNYINTPLVVISHNAPTFQSIDKKYLGSNINEGFANDLGGFISNTPEINLWIHGHTHNSANYTCGGTKVVANPIGYYGHEHYLNVFTPKVIEL